METKDKAPRWAILVGSGFGTGYCPVAPGTAGALLALLVWIGVDLLFPGSASWWTALALSLVFLPAGAVASGCLESWWGKDPSRVTIDEMVGTWLALLAVPSGQFWAAVGAFALFRLFDIYKPLGIRAMEKIRGGWGIMMDDVLAGIYSSVTITLALCIIR